MNDPATVRIHGPLAIFLSDFRLHLRGLGYSPGSAAQQLQLVAHLSGWMGERDLEVSDLSPETIEKFFDVRRLHHTNLRTPRALARFVEFLDDSGLKPVPSTITKGPAWEITLHRFQNFLDHERGLAATTVENYSNQVRPFLKWRTEHHHVELGNLSIEEITSFLLMRGTTEMAGSLKVAATALRAFLGWLYFTGITNRPLAEGILPVAYSAYGALPRAVPPEQVKAMSMDTDTGMAPYRDRSLILLFSRLGLRSREASVMVLADLNWRLGTLLVHGKGGVDETMPLPFDVGEAIAAYLEHERPATHERHVYLQANAPHAAMGRSGISSVVARAGARAGIEPPMGAHRLRHSAATGVLAAGGSLLEAAQLMRHTSHASTMIYAKVDLQALAALARPWPMAEDGATGTISGSEALT